MPITVTRWHFTDPLGIEPVSYTMPINPNQMTSPFVAARNLTVKTTTALNGQPIVWEGQQPLTEWTFQGTLLTEDQLNQMNTWRAKNYITTITDHFARTWQVYWEDFQATPAETTSHPYRHTYTAKVLVLGGPT